MNTLTGFFDILWNLLFGGCVIIAYFRFWSHLSSLKVNWIFLKIVLLLEQLLSMTFSISFISKKVYLSNFAKFLKTLNPEILQDVKNPLRIFILMKKNLSNFTCHTMKLNDSHYNLYRIHRWISHPWMRGSLVSNTGHLF